MEEDTIDLVAYYRVIWKRKVLIAVGTLVGLVAGVIVSLRLSDTYRADVLVEIGKKVTLPFNSSSPTSNTAFPSLKYLYTPHNLVEFIPIECSVRNEGSRYSLEVKMINKDSLIRITLEGSDKKAVEGSLRGVVNRIIDDHIRETEDSFRLFRSFQERLEAYIADVERGMDEATTRLKEMRDRNADHVAVEMALNRLWTKKTHLESAHRRLLLYQVFVYNIKEYYTRLIGDVGMSTMRPRRKRTVLMGGTACFVISLFLSFFIESLGKGMEGDNKENIYEKTTSC
jgi:hypothetical protein